MSTLPGRFLKPQSWASSTARWATECHGKAPVRTCVHRYTRTHSIVDVSTHSHGHPHEVIETVWQTRRPAIPRGPSVALNPTKGGLRTVLDLSLWPSGELHLLSCILMFGLELLMRILWERAVRIQLFIRCGDTGHPVHRTTQLPRLKSTCKIHLKRTKRIFAFLEDLACLPSNRLNTAVRTFPVSIMLWSSEARRGSVSTWGPKHSHVCDSFPSRLWTSIFICIYSDHVPKFLFCII